MEDTRQERFRASDARRRINRQLERTRDLRQKIARADFADPIEPATDALDNDVMQRLNSLKARKRQKVALADVRADIGNALAELEGQKTEGKKQLSVIEELIQTLDSFKASTDEGDTESAETLRWDYESLIATLKESRANEHQAAEALGSQDTSAQRTIYVSTRGARKELTFEAPSFGANPPPAVLSSDEDIPSLRARLVTERGETLALDQRRTAQMTDLNTLDRCARGCDERDKNQLQREKEAAVDKLDKIEKGLMDERDVADVVLGK